MFIIKFFLYFSLSFFILAIPIGGNPLFYSLEETARPITGKLFTYVKKKSKEGLETGTEVTKKFFSNTVPPKKDSVRVKESGTKKPLGKYTAEEKEFLQTILKKAQ